MRSTANPESASPTEEVLRGPNFSSLPPFFTENDRRNSISVGNPDLKPTHANNFDLLYEHYLKPLGILQAGFFYKDISDPIIP